MMGVLFLIAELIAMILIVGFHWSFWIPVVFALFAAAVYFAGKVQIDPTAVRSTRSTGGCLVLLIIGVFYIVGFYAIGDAFGQGWAIAAVTVSIIALIVG